MMVAEAKSLKWAPAHELVTILNHKNDQQLHLTALNLSDFIGVQLRECGVKELEISGTDGCRERRFVPRGGWPSVACERSAADHGKAFRWTATNVPDGGLQLLRTSLDPTIESCLIDNEPGATRDLKRSLGFSQGGVRLPLTLSLSILRSLNQVAGHRDEVFCSRNQSLIGLDKLFGLGVGALDLFESVAHDVQLAVIVPSVNRGRDRHDAAEDYGTNALKRKPRRSFGSAVVAAGATFIGGGFLLVALWLWRGWRWRWCWYWPYLYLCMILLGMLLVQFGSSLFFLGTWFE